MCPFDTSRMDFLKFQIEETKVINMGYGFTTLNPYYPIYQFLNMSLEKTFKMFGQHDYLGVKPILGEYKLMEPLYKH